VVALKLPAVEIGRSQRPRQLFHFTASCAVAEGDASG